MESTKILSDENRFHKHLGKFSCLMIGIGGLIGGGIFSVIGVISIYTGPYAYISYLITAIITLITVYSYQKLNFKWYGPGGEYSVVQGAFVNTKFHNLGLFVGLLLCFGYISSMALYAYTFSVYFLFLFNIQNNYFLISIIITILFLIFTLLNLKGVKESARLQNILVIIKVIILILFSILGISYALNSPAQMLSNVGLDIDSLRNLSFLGIIIGSSSIVVSYQGFQLIAYGSAEMKDTRGGLKMMRWSIIISMIIYCLVGFTAIAILGISGLVEGGVQYAEVAIANAALNFMGPFGMVIVIFGALLSTASALNATILGSSRLIYLLAKEKIFPKKFSYLSNNKVPHNAILFISILSVILTIITGGALSIAKVAAFIFTQVFFIMNFTNYKVHKKTESKKLLPLIGMILTGALFLILLIFNIVNIATEFISFISFVCMQIVILFLITHIKNNKNNHKHKFIS
ncbi:MAG: APC family permease [Promethearchaeota archaeon]